jgi:CheY-like chemotaxis protein
MYSLPVFYYQSAMMMLDDDPAFMQAVSFLFEGIYSLRTYLNPWDFISDYKKDYEKNSFNQILKYADGVSTGDAVVNLNIADIYKLAVDAAHQEMINVIIVDYHMPDMNGIELCKMLEGYPVKKILLTGAASVGDAINALNEGVIDCYLTKGSHSMVDDLKKYVDQLGKKYYIDLTAPLLSCLEAGNPLPLTDPIFVGYINQFIQKNAITGYALIDKNGSLIFRDKYEKSIYFIVQTDKSLNDFMQLNDDVNDAELYLNLIKTREQIPFFGIGRECWEFQVGEWQDHFYAAEKLIGREDYYIAVFDGVKQ